MHATTAARTAHNGYSDLAIKRALFKLSAGPDFSPWDLDYMPDGSVWFNGGCVLPIPDGCYEIVVIPPRFPVELRTMRVPAENIATAIDAARRIAAATDGCPLNAHHYTIHTIVNAAMASS